MWIPFVIYQPWFFFWGGGNLVVFFFAAWQCCKYQRMFLFLEPYSPLASLQACKKLPSMERKTFIIISIIEWIIDWIWRQNLFCLVRVYLIHGMHVCSRYIGFNNNRIFTLCLCFFWVFNSSFGCNKRWAWGVSWKLRQV